MKSNFGDCFQISLFGESHSAAIGIVINGLAAGIKLDMEKIEHELSKRRAKGKISTARREGDKPVFISGLFKGFTTGTPLCAVIENLSQKSGDYEKQKDLLRPSHADFTAYEKYGGFQDYRGGGHFSGRLTAPLVLAGAIAKQLLERKGIKIGTHIKKLHHICDIPFSSEAAAISKQIEYLDIADYPAIDKDIAQQMTAFTEQTAKEGDSIGGVLETAVIGMPAGIGEPFFNSVESKLSSLLFSVPAVKGVEFGLGFDFAELYGSQANDSLVTDGEKITTKTNNNGGINGGISNGMPILIKTAVKPTPSIFKEQETVNIAAMENTKMRLEGRHDPAVIHRARVVADAVTAIGLVDLFCERYGCEWTKS